MNKIEVFDSTLRDGAQGGNISFSLEDKCNIARALDKLEIDFIEAGNPYSNPKDAEFFKNARSLHLKHANLVAFGATRRHDIRANQDKNCLALVEAETEIVSIFGKSSAWQVSKVLGTTPQENLCMISDTISFLTSLGKQVFFDAEHFFDGYKEDPSYALQTLEKADQAGAKRLILCDTKGGSFPNEIEKIIRQVQKKFPGKLGIHCHDDMGCAVSSTLYAVKEGAVQVQGTYLGIGERCGNTNLSTVIANLQLKLDYCCIPQNSMSLLTKTARYIADVSNFHLPHTMPYVGMGAFAHKGGMHVDGVHKNTGAFEHIKPEAVGNERHILLSEVAGRTALLEKISMIVPALSKSSPQIERIMEAMKDMENEGYQFEAATASFELMVLKELGLFHSFFELELFRIIGEQDCDNRHMASAMVKLRVGEQYEITADEGDGPVHALDRALRKALERFFPSLDGVRLTDYKVRVINSKATAAQVRVLVDSSDGESVWTTVGVSTDIINASMRALVDSMEYKLYHSDLSLKDK